MNCPQCGLWNRASLTACARCGAPLGSADGKPAWKEKLRDQKRGSVYYRPDEEGVVDEALNPDQRDELAEEMAQLKTRKAEGYQRLRRMQVRSAERGAAPTGRHIRTQSADAFWRDPDDTGRSARIDWAGPNASQTRISRKSAADVPPSPVDDEDDETWDDSHNWDPLWAEQDAYGHSFRTGRYTSALPLVPKRVARFHAFLKFMGIVLLIGLCGAAGFFGYKYFEARAQQADDQNKASVFASIKDDLAAHTILIPGNDGEQIYIRELHTSYIVEGGFATIEVADHTWYDSLEEVTEPQMEVTLTPFMKTASGRQQPMSVINYTIDIPLSPIELNTPDTPVKTVSASMYTMSFTVRPASKVTINGKDVSDTVNADTGTFFYNATVQPIGDNVFTVTCRSQYCRESSMTVTLYREPQEIPLDLAATTYSSTSSSKMLVSCTTLPGATVEVLSPFSDLNITNLSSTGAFTFYALFDHIGNNTILINSSFPGKKTSTIEYTVYYVPSPDVYTPKAWPLTAAGYSELVSNIAYRAEHSQVYVVIGTLQYFVSEKPQMAVFNTSDDGKSQPVMVENYSRTTWVAGQFYRIYADAYSTYNNMPWLCARYTYDN